jgi:uncharacterized protein YciI
VRYLVLCTDRSGAASIRRRTRKDHLRYIAAREHRVVLGARLLDSDDSDTEAVGTTYVLRANSREEVEEFLREEPFTRAGLFDEIRIYPLDVRRLVAD